MTTKAVSDWDLGYLVAIEIPTKLESLAVVSRCDFGPYLSAAFRYEERLEKGGTHARTEAFLPFRALLSPTAVAFAGPGLLRLNKANNLAVRVGVDVTAMARLSLRAEMTNTFEQARPKILLGQSADYQLRSGGRRRDFLGLRFEVLRASDARDARFLVTTGSRF